MKKLNPSKLHVEFSPCITPTAPIVGRKYTLTHSDITADLFLTIGLEYAVDQINKTRDKVFTEWRTYNCYPFLYVYVYVNGELGPTESAVRNAAFRRELPLALEAIRYGDRRFFAEYPELDNAPLWIHFDSTDPFYDRFENWGSPKDYR